MIPSAFLRRVTLRNLNVLAVGVSLAAITATVFGGMYTTSFLDTILATGTPTLAIGALWAMLLRYPKTLGKTRLRAGWLLSVPLAALNGACAVAATFIFTGGKSPWIGFLVGGSLGIIVWGPALLLTLLFFGLPIHLGQKMAAKGLAGEDRGEFLVGFAALLVSAMALTVTLVLASGWAHTFVSFRHPQSEFDLALALLRVCACAGIALGGAAATLAVKRLTQRNAFVRAVESGSVAGYRVEATDEGKVLLRVHSQGQGSYRITDVQEELVALDEVGEAKTALKRRM
jgi:hypothetical protein